MAQPESHGQRQHAQRQRWELLEQINALTDTPLIALSFVWLALLIRDLIHGLGPLLQGLTYLIWALFILDFGIEIIIAPHKRDYLRRNWLTAISLLLPALRVLRLFRAFRLLQAVRATRSISLIRLLTSLNRGMRAVSRTLGQRGVGYVVTLTVVVTFAGAAGMAFFEHPNALREAGYRDAAQADAGLAGYGEAVWWTAMIMTTMGSEYWPKTVEGRILAWLLSLYAFAIFGYITATIASYFVGQDRQAQGQEAVVPDLQALREEIAALQTHLAAATAQLNARTANRQDRERWYQGEERP